MSASAVSYSYCSMRTVLSVSLNSQMIYPLNPDSSSLPHNEVIFVFFSELSQQLLDLLTCNFI